ASASSGTRPPSASPTATRPTGCSRAPTAPGGGRDGMGPASPGGGGRTMRRIATALLTLTLAASAGAIERLRDVPLQANALAATRPSVRAALGRAAPAGPTAAELAKMEAAAPDKPRVRPERPRRL